jgi:hypothetical protein
VKPKICRMASRVNPSSWDIRRKVANDLQTESMGAHGMDGELSRPGSHGRDATTADHTKFKELQKQFNSGPEVTKACLACHTEAAGQIHRTKHWKWEYLNPDTKQTLGKKTVVNNFCISIASNYASCTSCHVGYGWKDANFDFKSEENVDCLAVPRHQRQLQEAARPGRQCRHQGHGVSARLGQDPEGHRPCPRSRRRSARPVATPAAPATSTAAAATASSTATWTVRWRRRPRTSTSTWTPKAWTSPAAPATSFQP